MVKIISFFYTVFLARSLGVNNFGLYVTALAYFSIISSVADFGITRFLTREVSISQDKIGRLLASAIFLRLSILSVFFAFFSISAYFLDTNLNRRTLSILAVLAALPQSISFTLDAALVASLKVKWSALGILSLGLLSTLAGIVLVLLGYGPYGAVLGLIIGQLLYVGVLFLISFNQKVNWWGVTNGELLKEMVRGSLPYGLLGVLGLIYFRVDTLMLSYLRGSFETGIYGVAYKFLEASVFIPTAAATAIFPVLARLQEVDLPQIRKIYFKSLKVMGVLGIIILLSYIFILPLIIRLFLPSYIQAISVIQILALSIPFMFIHVPASQVLLSSEKYLKPILLLSLFPLTFNIVTNLIFIPQFGYIAASWITVASDVISFLALYIYIQRYFLKYV